MAAALLNNIQTMLELIKICTMKYTHILFHFPQISHIVRFKLGHQANFQGEAQSVSALKLNVYNYEIHEDPVYIKTVCEATIPLFFGDI
jgi:hypothetical protein